MSKQIAGGILCLLCAPLTTYLITAAPTFDGRSFVAGFTISLGALGLAVFLNGFNKEH